MRIGLISDTHGLARPEALAALRGVELILHAGDIGDPAVIAALLDVAPVIAVRGNNDSGDWAEVVAEREVFALAQRRVLLLHELKHHDEREHFDVVVYGHSHRPLAERRNGTLYVNPGSAGPRRFSLPISIAHLDLNGAEPDVRFQELG